MTIKHLVQFTTDLPDDSIEEDGNFVQWSGKGVSEAIAEMLRRRGYDVSEPDCLEHAGWELGISKGKRSFIARISEIYDFHLSLHPSAWFGGGKKWPEYREVLNAVNEALRSDGRFHNIRWFDDYEPDLNKPGAASPVDD